MWTVDYDLNYNWRENIEHLILVIFVIKNYKSN